MTESTQSPKELAAAIAQVRLDCFLQSRATLDFTSDEPPRISIVMLVFNRAEVTLSCLQSLMMDYNKTPYELIIVDNGSNDETTQLCSQLLGVKLLRNVENEGFPKAVNQGAALAEGEYLLLLNNDSEVLGNGLDEAVKLLDENEQIGVVGGRIVLLDGTLQEAGCGLWDDGWTYQYGRGEAVNNPAYNFQRDVDYCSAVCLMIRTRLFREIGQLNEDFSPGYFEDPELSVRVWKSGHRIVYLPTMVVLHYENATSEGLFNLPEQCRRNHGQFVSLHNDWLADQARDRVIPPLFVRLANDTTLKVLLILYPTDQTSTLDSDRVVTLLQHLDAAPTVVIIGEPNHDHLSHFKTVERYTCSSHEFVRQLLTARDGFYDLILCEKQMNSDLQREIECQGIPSRVWSENRFISCNIY